MKMKKLIYIGLSVILFSLSACREDFLNTEYTDGIDKETASQLAINDPEALNGYLNGIFAHMVAFDIHGTAAHDDFSFMSILHSTDLMGENMVQEKSHWFTWDYQHDNHEYNYRRTSVNWRTFYTIIAKSNEIINFFEVEPTTTGSKGILGQAYALRGMSYYYLIQLYQHTNPDDPANLDKPGVPMRYANVEVEKQGWTEEEVHAKTGRNTVREVFEQIESDLTYSVELLDAGYVRPQKYFINAAVAKGLLARYYLLAGKYELAASTAKAARAGFPIMNPSALHDGFIDISNSEWMWGFDHNTETQTTYASFFSHVSNIAPGYAGLNYAPRLIDARLYSNISNSDERKKLFIGPNGPSADQLPVAVSTASRLPYANLKFGDDGNWTMDYVYMRASEMVLIEAEAMAHLRQTGAAATVLAELMEKRDPNWSESNVTVDDVFLQRSIELWGEGFEFFDRKRLNKGIHRNYDGTNHRVGARLTIPAGYKTWIYQLPVSEIQENDLIDMEDRNE
jgi:starch-binding outer membrane protein, SusD/RagB family